MDYKKFYENVKIHFEMLCTDEIRQHAFASKEHDLDFQVFRVLCGYQELLDSRSNEVANTDFNLTSSSSSSSSESQVKS